MSKEQLILNSYIKLELRLKLEFHNHVRREMDPLEPELEGEDNEVLSKICEEITIVETSKAWTIWK